MSWPLLMGRKRKAGGTFNSRQRATAALVTALQRQDTVSMFVKREQWTEHEVQALPAGEHDYFDRKSGLIFDDLAARANLYDTLAKAASAFANTGGGHLVLGVADDGAFDGVPPIISGSTTTRDWLEQKLPDLLDYRLSDFRVHTVVRATPSSIPLGREVVVVDIGDSALAPHQSRRHSTYYYRSAGRSLPAPHFYLELLRQRLTNAALDFDLQSVEVEDAWKHEGSLIMRVLGNFEIKNTGRIAAYKWALVARRMHQIPDDRVEDYFFGNIPGNLGRNSSMRVDDTILSGCWCSETKVFGVRLRPGAATERQIRGELDTLLSNMRLTLQLATETSPGDEKEVSIGPLLNVDNVMALLRSKDLVQDEGA
jgi:hypothetical protein